MIYENLNARNSDTIRGIRHLPSAIVMKKSIQIGKKLHRTLAEPMQEQYTSIEEKCNTCQKLLSNFKKPFADAVGDIEIVLVISRGHVAGVEFA